MNSEDLTTHWDGDIMHIFDDIAEGLFCRILIRRNTNNFLADIERDLLTQNAVTQFWFGGGLETEVVGLWLGVCINCSSIWGFLVCLCFVEPDLFLRRRRN